MQIRPQITGKQSKSMSLIDAELKLQPYYVLNEL